MSFRLTVLMICLVLLVGGAGLVQRSWSIPEWTDANAAEATQTWDPPEASKGPEYDAYNARWFKSMNALRTNKWPTYDAGAGLMALAVSLAAAMFLLRIKNISDLGKLQTPKRRWAIYGTATLGWFGYMASGAAALLEGFDRLLFPPWADNLLIPVVSVAAAAVAGWLVLSFAGWLALRHAVLPVSLWVWRKDMPARDWVFTVAAGLSLLFAAEVLRETFLYGHWGAVPSMLVWIYATLSFRAAGISRG